MKSEQILVGVGDLYIAPVGTVFPDLTAAPGAPWRYQGETDDGVKVTKTRSIEEHSVDQRTGPVKATVTEEGLTVEVNLAILTLENLADVLGVVVTDTPAGVGVIGTREVPLYTGAAVVEFAILFRGSSPYGAAYPAQYQLPRGYFSDDLGLEYKKDGKTLIPVKFMALEDLNAASPAERFGKLIAQDADAL